MFMLGWMTVTKELVGRSLVVVRVGMNGFRDTSVAFWSDSQFIVHIRCARLFLIRDRLLDVVEYFFLLAAY
jgi:hypothetical protein